MSRAERIGQWERWGKADQWMLSLSEIGARTSD
jgi:hypothetical protein